MQKSEPFKKKYIFRGGIMLVHDHKTKKSEVIDFMEMATSAADPDFFKGDRSLLEKVSIGKIFVHQLQINKWTDIKFWMNLSFTSQKYMYHTFASTL